MKTQIQDIQLRIPKEENPYYKDNPQYFDELLDLIEKHPKGFQASLNASKRHLSHWMLKQLPKISDTKTYSNGTRCYWILNGLTDFPICKICKKNDNYIGKNVKSVADGYHDYCSISCMQKDPMIQKKKMQTRCSPHIQKIHLKSEPKKVSAASKQQHDVPTKVESNPYFENSCEMYMRLLIIMQDFPNGYVPKINNTRNYDLRQWIDSQLPLLDYPEYRLGTKIYWILNGLTDFPKCHCYGCEVKFDKDSVGPRSYNVNPYCGYGTFCSCKCQANSPEIKAAIKASKLRNYGNENYNNREKAFETMFRRYGPLVFKMIYDHGCSTKEERYGNRFWNNPEKIKLAWAKMTKEQKQTIVKKSQDTYERMTGYRTVTQNPEMMVQIVEKIASTMLKQYGVRSYSQTEECQLKVIATNRERYGADFYMQTDEFKERSKQTCNEKYGVDFYTQSQECKDRMSDPSVISRRMERQIATKKRNGTLNTSAPEKEGLKILQDTFGVEDVLQQYKSEMYPFHCDYYVKSLDLYIELNQHWSHGGHFYDENDEGDRATVEQWRKNGTKYYLNSIQVWTQRDIQKRDIAMKNQLHYIVFWNIEELRMWITDLASKKHSIMQ